MRAMEKIRLATEIDLFITSYATDSIYPSCVVKKPGIVYSPSKTGYGKKLHIHHDILEVDDASIKSLSNDPNTPWYDISVSMDWRDIYKLIVTRLAISPTTDFGEF